MLSRIAGFPGPGRRSVPAVPVRSRLICVVFSIPEQAAIIAALVYPALKHLPGPMTTGDDTGGSVAPRASFASPSRLKARGLPSLRHRPWAFAPGPISKKGPRGAHAGFGIDGGSVTTIAEYGSVGYSARRGGFYPRRCGRFAISSDGRSALCANPWTDWIDFPMSTSRQRVARLRHGR